MPGSTFGQLFRVTTAGESHGPANVVIVDGVPPGLALSEDDLQPDLDRRRPGQSSITTQRDEADQAEFLSGVFEGQTTGTPIAVLVRNQDSRSRDYKEIADKYRPGHADFTYDAKYGLRDYRGGGRSSARETVARVAAGAIARKLLSTLHGVNVVGFVRQVGSIVADVIDPAAITRAQVEANIIRCPDARAADSMIALIEQVRGEMDSVGGIAEIVATNVPPGWGEPVFDKLKADLGKAMLSIPAVVGVEFGEGFAAAAMRGSQHNDLFIRKAGVDASRPAIERITTATDRHGGTLGGISSGLPIVLRCAVKPTSSIPKPQATVTRNAEPTTIATKGRHDPCLLPRFVPVGEAMMLITLADHALRQRALRG